MAQSDRYANLYQSKQWDDLRRAIYKRDMFQCRWQGCGKLLIGKAPAPNSPVAHHTVPHRGNLKIFWDAAKIITVCKQCHDGPIQTYERKGYVKGYDKSGKPIDPNHPWNQGEAIK